jgi:YhcN/YlaJ family sporulation lipoprotein
MNRKAAVAAVAAAVLACSAGCTMMKSGQEGRRVQQETYRTTRVSDNLYRDVKNNAERNARYNTSNNMVSHGVRLADDVAGSIAGMKNVKTASVLIMGRTAYVGVMMEQHQSVTDAVKKEIANRARAVDPAIRQVYVSANPDFVKQMQEYGTDIRAGRPVSGLLNKLTDLVRRTFPHAE